MCGVPLASAWLCHLTLFSPHLVPSLTMPGSGTSGPSMKSTPQHFVLAMGVLMMEGSMPNTVPEFTFSHCSFPHLAFLQGSRYTRVTNTHMHCIPYVHVNASTHVCTNSLTHRPEQV